MWGENIQNSYQGCFLHTHQNHTYYPYQSTTPHYNPRIPLHPNTKKPPHPNRRIPPNTICSCTYWNYSPIYAPYGVSRHRHIMSLSYLYCPLPNNIPLYMYPKLICPYFHPHYSRSMTEHRRKRRNKLSKLNEEE